MEKSPEITTTNSEGVCKKFYQTIAANCASRKTHRPRHRPEEQTPCPGESVNVPIESKPNKNKADPPVSVHINPVEPKIGASVAIPKDDKAMFHGKDREDNESVYADYITDVRSKMGIRSKVGTETKKTEKPANRLASVRRDSFSDKIANFIKLGRKKFRSPSNIGQE